MTIKTFVPTLILSLYLVLFSVAQVAASEEPKISGEIINGLRILTLQEQADNSLVVYRGDYIQPRLADGGSFEMVIPQMQVKKSFPAAEGENAYIKMKVPGTYSFKAGSAGGHISVIEYQAPSYKEVTASEAEQILKNTNPIILDVRTPAEYRQGHIEGAQLLPVQVFQRYMDKLSSYKNHDVFIYCATGNRSTVASRLLIENGFNKIYNLRYGISDWSKKGFPIVQP